MAVLLCATSGVLNELGPPVALTLNCLGGAEFNGRFAVEPFDERMPRNIEAQIAGFVHDA
jgi:hypothetical protein